MGIFRKKEQGWTLDSPGSSWEAIRESKKSLWRKFLEWIF